MSSFRSVNKVQVDSFFKLKTYEFLNLKVRAKLGNFYPMSSIYLDLWAYFKRKYSILFLGRVAWER